MTLGDHLYRTVSSNVTSNQMGYFCVTTITDVCNGWPCGSHALYVFQGCQTACPTHIGSMVWQLLFSCLAAFTQLNVCPSMTQTGSGAG